MISDNQETFQKLADNSSTFAFVITSTLIWKEKAFPHAWVSVNISRQRMRILASEWIFINRAPSFSNLEEAWRGGKGLQGVAVRLNLLDRSRSNSLIRAWTNGTRLHCRLSQYVLTCVIYSSRVAEVTAHFAVFYHKQCFDVTVTASGPVFTKPVLVYARSRHC